MRTKKIVIGLGITAVALFYTSCIGSSVTQKKENKTLPAGYYNSQDSSNTAKITWKRYFTDANLNTLIDTALKNNQELNIMLQEIQVAKNEVRARKGEYLPFIGARANAGVDKVGRNTSQGASDAITYIAPGKPTPEVLPNYMFGVYASWEVDIWQKLRNAKRSAFNRFLGSIEGKNFMVTKLISEIANSYYELLALDNQLEIVKQNIDIQTNALKIVRLEKDATRVTELAVRRFEAEVYHTRSLQFDIQQKITETENKINFLVGRFPQPVQRTSQTFVDLPNDTVYVGVPAQLLQNRTDIKRAERNLAAAKLDVKVAKARFYPSLNISGGIGYQAFNAAYLIKSPQSLIYTLAGDLIAPLINRNAIKATYYSANAKQIQAVYDYERTILNAYIEVANEVSNISNLKKSYDLKTQQVEALNQSITISTNLFKSARADYMEVLLTQRDALESKFELIETKKQQMTARVNIYRALGGGWN
ncbi:RND transporter [Sphingobacteriaceae bacterium]|nr:RND transporter [Sphingobacteriaceae bacterium]